MAERAGTTRKAANGKGRVSAKEKARRQAQAQEATGAATLPTGESVAEVRAALEEAAKRGETGRTVGAAEADGAVATSPAELRARAMGELLRMPSGLVARVRRPGMIALLQSGTIPNTLLPLIEKGMEAGAKGTEVTQAEIMGEVTPDMMSGMLELFDLVTMFVVVEPQLLPNPDGPQHEWPTHDEAGRELAYIGWVPDEDKQFIFNYAVGGTRDVDRFLQDQQTSVVESL